MRRRKRKKTTASRIRIIFSLMLVLTVFYYIHKNPQKIQEIFAAASDTPIPNGQANAVQDAKEPQGGLMPEHLEIPLCPASASLHTPRQAVTGTDSAAGHELIMHDGYALCYRETYEQAEWAAYKITKDRLEKRAERSDNFRQDLSVSTGSALPADYKGTGYDRGHLVPAADMAFSDESMSQSFYMSNMSPQSPALNRGAWKELEEAVRRWAVQYGSIYVVSGPVLEKAHYPTIGRNEVAVPEYFYKVLLAPADGGVQTAAFILPNGQCDGPLSLYAVTVDAAEERTGIDFYALLDDDLENKAESILDLSRWQ